MSQTVFDFAQFERITKELMQRAPDRGKAVMVENNAYYFLVNMHIFLTNMAEFSDSHDSALESLIDQVAREVERIQQVKGSRWLDDFIAQSGRNAPR